MITSPYMTPEKTNLLNQFLEGYTPQYRYKFCEIALAKHQSENYKFSDKNISSEDLIVKDTHVRYNIQSIINKGECSKEDFTNVFNMLTVNQINYIGY
jgi:hypothetical protein